MPLLKGIELLSHKDDDHPPAGVTRGQSLIRSVHEALRTRSEWPRTLLIVTYDEHGGYYVQPVCHEVLDHTSIVRTLLEQFCPDPDDALKDMPRRVREWSKSIPPSLFQGAASAVMSLSGPLAAAEAKRRTSPGSTAPRLGTGATTRARRPSAAALSAVDAKLEDRRKALSRKRRRVGSARVSALQRALRPLLQLLHRRGVVKSRQLPASWRGR